MRAEGSPHKDEISGAPSRLRRSRPDRLFLAYEKLLDAHSISYALMRILGVRSRNACRGATKTST